MVKCMVHRLLRRHISVSTSSEPTRTIPSVKQKAAPLASLLKHKDKSRYACTILNKPCTGSPSAVKAFCEQAPPPGLRKHQTGLQIHEYLDRA